MKRKFILLDPDPSEPGGGGDPAPAPEPAKTKPADPPTSADTGAKGKTAREIALEKKVATLEDEQNSLKGQLKQATDWIAKQVETEKKPGKESLVDEINSFLGCGLD